ncbi:hypothetical protein [Psychrobacter sp. 72-O-c]|uniref:hypothetical protein n=2 Tax=Psychrobacter sp. 72-O-c TaxID=2774125 RepID=UPI0019199939|nr:hypothetical protein [Psychrobacter sp. 72-O-c]
MNECDKDVAESLAKPMAENIISLDVANCCLMSSVVKHLADKGLIDLEEYIASNEENEKMFSDRARNNKHVDDELGQRDAQYISEIFDLHRSHLENPE